MHFPNSLPPSSFASEAYLSEGDLVYARRRQPSGFLSPDPSLGRAIAPVRLPVTLGLYTRVYATRMDEGIIKAREFQVYVYCVATNELQAKMEFTLVDNTKDCPDARLWGALDEFMPEMAFEVHEAAKEYALERGDGPCPNDDEAQHVFDGGLSNLFSTGGVLSLDVIERLPDSRARLMSKALAAVARELCRRYKLSTLVLCPYPLQYSRGDTCASTAEGDSVSQRDFYSALEKLRYSYASAFRESNYGWTSRGALVVEMGSHCKFL